MKIYVVTASIGRTTDSLRIPKLAVSRRTSAKFIAYVSPDHGPISGPWERREVRGTDPAHLTRMVKIMCHEGPESDADFWIWLDASFKLRMMPEDLIRKYLFPKNMDLARFKHPWHCNIRQEAQALKECGKVREADWPLLDQQVADYASQGWVQSEQSCGGFLLRRNSPKIKAMNQIWWDQYNKYRHGRDQMSFDYAIWKSGVRPRWIPGKYWKFPGASWRSQ
jgi:hypothetical protein